MKLELDFVAEGAIRDKKTSTLEAWIWSIVRIVFGDGCGDCARPCGWNENDQIHQCHRCYAELCDRTRQCEHFKYLTENCLQCGRFDKLEV